MERNTFYDEILIDHNLHPAHKQVLEGANLVLEGVNPTCGDDLVIQLKVEEDQIVDGAFMGNGCAVSQASADIMLDMIIGRSKQEALQLAELFMKMVRKEATPEEMEQLQEAGVLRDVSHMPARVKCAVLGWHTMEELFEI